MRFNVPVVQSMVLPSGATTGQRIVIDGTAGTITMYDANNQVTGLWSAPAQQFSIYQSGSNQNEFARFDAGSSFPNLELQPSASKYTGGGAVVQGEEFNVDGGQPVLHLTSPNTLSGDFAEISLIGDTVGGAQRSTATVAAKAYDPVGHTHVGGTILADSGWNFLTLASGYSTFSGFHTPAYNVLSDGLVKLRGALHLTNGNPFVSASVFCTLPAGLRPNGVTESFLCASESSTAGLGVRVDIGSNGNMTLVYNQTGYSAHWLDLGNIMFSIV